jgi:hypothetical protein
MPPKKSPQFATRHQKRKHNQHYNPKYKKQDVRATAQNVNATADSASSNTGDHNPAGAVSAMSTALATTMWL